MLSSENISRKRSISHFWYAGFCRLSSSLCLYFYPQNLSKVSVTEPLSSFTCGAFTWLYTPHPRLPKSSKSATIATFDSWPGHRWDFCLGHDWEYPRDTTDTSLAPVRQTTLTSGCWRFLRGLILLPHWGFCWPYMIFPPILACKIPTEEDFLPQYPTPSDWIHALGKEKRWFRRRMKWCGNLLWKPGCYCGAIRAVFLFVVLSWFPFVTYVD